MAENVVPIIELKNVSKAFGPMQVLDGINLSIRRAQTTVILGESGTGKSVLLKTIIGLLKPDRGQVIFDGTDLAAQPERELARIRIRFGFLFQGGALFDSMNAGENIAFTLRQHTRMSDEKIRQIVRNKLRLVGLEGIESKMPAKLSGGQKKRVALARAIAMNPEVILYDEPTTGLDPIRSDVINELIIRLKDRLHVTSIVVTHDMKSAFKVADRVLMLYQGKFIFDGTTDELQHCLDERVRQFVAGQADPKELEALRVTEPGQLGTMA
jgi:phospholipid/cholesterol/gamma-HCH transport system ATP-binding protein